MKSAKQLLREPDEELEVDEDAPREIKPVRGGKLLKEKKPSHAARVLFDKTEESDRPVNVYKERVTDADTGKTGFFMWWTTEDSQTIGRQPLVKMNPRTQEERPIGYEFTIPYDEKLVKDLISKSYSKTKFYQKDGSSRISIQPEQF
jgi:hypothetical protein